MQTLAIAAAALVGVGMALPAAAAERVGDDMVEEILVVGARLPRAASDVLGHIDVVTREDLLRDMSVGMEDLLRYVPGVSVVRAGPRFGATEMTIRGLSGNRVTTLIDGVPLADQFDIGAFANAGQDYLVADAVSRVEILRGPASTLFGSDALGGVLAVVTRDPEEYLGGRDVATGAALTWRGADRARVLGVSAAGRRGAWSGVLHGSAVDATERDAAATSAEDPLARSQRALTLKSVHQLAAGRLLPGGGALRVKGDLFDEQVRSRPDSVLGFGRQFRNTTALSGDDQRQRHALQVGLDFDGLGFMGLDERVDHGRLVLHAERTRVRQITHERRDVRGQPHTIRRQFDYRVAAGGAQLDLESRFALGATTHRLGWGASARRASIAERRDGVQQNLVSGAISRTLLGERLPVRDFPRSSVTELAAYVHDEVAIGNTVLIPGVRFETYRLNAKTDSLFSQDHPGLAVADVDEMAVVPKLGVRWQRSARLSLFAQYAHGFRAPPFEDVNIGLDIPLFNVRAIANPDLRAESSDGVELGARFNTAAWSAELVMFGARYHDFIESKAPLGPDPDSGVLLFQSRNISRARIHGAELSVAADLSQTLTLQASAHWTRGRDRTTGASLSTVEPATLVARLTWQSGRRWHASLVGTAVAARTGIEVRSGQPFEPAGYATFDATAGLILGDGLRLDVGLFNLTNRVVWPWASVRGRLRGDPQLDLLAAPARYGAISIHATL